MFNYTPNDRVGDLGQLASSNPADQTNPITGGTLDFPFAGIKFETNPLIDPTPMLGASVAGLRTASGQGAILIGAPGGLNSSNTDPGTGRAYLVYESANGDFNNYVGDSINLDDPNFATDYPGLNLVTFESSATGGQLGYSVAGGSNMFGDGQNDVILGAPSATVAPSTSTSPVNSNTGVVYALSLAALPSGTADDQRREHRPERQQQRAVRRGQLRRQSRVFGRRRRRRQRRDLLAARTSTTS